MVNKLMTRAVVLDSLTLVYIQGVIMLTELLRVLSQELQSLCTKTSIVLME